MSVLSTFLDELVENFCIDQVFFGNTANTHIPYSSMPQHTQKSPTQPQLHNRSSKTAFCSSSVASRFQWVWTLRQLLCKRLFGFPWDKKIYESCLPNTANYSETCNSQLTSEESFSAFSHHFNETIINWNDPGVHQTENKIGYQFESIRILIRHARKSLASFAFY